MGKKINLKNFAHNIVKDEMIFGNIDVKHELIELLDVYLTKRELKYIDYYIQTEKRYLKILKLKENVRIR